MTVQELKDLNQILNLYYTLLEESQAYYPASSTEVGPIIKQTTAVKSRMMMSRSGPSTMAAYVTPQNGLILNKTAIVSGDDPQDDSGRQIFKLDLTAEATSIPVTNSVPVDIVMVLDTSGSMEDNFKAPLSQIATSPNTSSTYYVKVGGGYEQIRHDSGNTWYYWDWFIISYKRYVKYESSNANTDKGDTDSDSPKAKEFYITKLDALKKAANDFTQKIYTVSDQSKVAVVSFASGSTNVTSTLLPVKSGTTLNSGITNAINGLNAGGATRADMGIKTAQGIFAADNATGRNRVVIMFTDGVPTTSDTFDNDVATSAMRWAKVLKGDRTSTVTTTNVSMGGSSGINNPGDSLKGNGATVYTLGVFPSNVNNSVHQYMWRTSSATKDSAAQASGYTYAPSDSNGYYLTADSVSTLNAIFTSITTQAGQTVSHVDIRDYIDPDFKIVNPTSGVELGVNAIIENGDHDGTVMSDGTNTYVLWHDQEISPPDPQTSKLASTFHGSVYVKAKDSFVGGNNVPTNIANITGVYVNSSGTMTNIGSFPNPLVNVPMKFSTTPAVDYILLGENVPDDNATAQLAMLPDLTDYSVAYAWTCGGTPVTTLTSEKPSSTTAYNLSATVQPKDFRPTGAPVGTIYNPTSGISTVGTVAAPLNKTGTYTVNVVTPTFGSAEYNLFLGETVANAQPTQQDFSAALAPAAPDGTITGLSTTYASEGWATHWSTYKTRLLYTAALSGTDGAGLGTLPTHLYEYTPTAFSGTSKVNVTVAYNAGTPSITSDDTVIATGNAASNLTPIVTVNVVSGKLTLNKTIDSKYPAEASVNAAQSFVFKIVRTSGLTTETFYEVINFNATDANTKSRTISGLKVGTYTVTEETGGSWRYSLQNTNSPIIFGQNDSRVNGVVTKSTIFINHLTNQKWFGDTTYAVNQFITSSMA